MKSNPYHNLLINEIKPYSKIAKIPLKRLNNPLLKVANFIGYLSSSMMFKTKIMRQVTYIESRDGCLIRLDFYQKKDIKPKGILLYVHGGAFILGEFPNMHKRAIEYANRTDLVVCFIHYRLLPKYTYPTQINDVEDVYLWLMKHHTKLGLTSFNPLFIGDSAGGCIVSSLVFKLVDNNQPVLGQLLVYPVLSKKLDTESMRKYQNSPGWNAVLNKEMWRLYLKDQPLDRYCSPGDIEKVLNLPKTFLEISEIDCLRDEGYQFYLKLQQQQVNVVFHEVKGVFHGFDVLKGLNVTKNAIKNRVDFMNECYK